MPRLNQTKFNIQAAKKLYDAGLGYDKIGLVLGASKPSLKRLFMHRGWHKGNRGRVLNSEAARTRLARNVMREFV